MRQPTIDVAKHWAKTGVDILFTEKDPFNGEVKKEFLEENLYNQILINIVDHDTTDVSEAQLQECIKLSKTIYERKSNG